MHPTKIVAHELKFFEECTLANSGIVWNHGFDKAVCTCGWKSAASKDHKALVSLWEIHLKNS